MEAQVLEGLAFPVGETRALIQEASIREGFGGAIATGDYRREPPWELRLRRRLRRFLLQSPLFLLRSFSGDSGVREFTAGCLRYFLGSGIPSPSAKVELAQPPSPFVSIHSRDRRSDRERLFAALMLSQLLSSPSEGFAEASASQ